MTDSEAIQLLARELTPSGPDGKVVSGGVADLLLNRTLDLENKVNDLEAKLTKLLQPAKLAGTLTITPGG